MRRLIVVLLTFVMAVVGYFVLSEWGGWKMMQNPSRALETRVHSGDTFISLNEIFGDSWEKLCVLPLDGTLYYMNAISEEKIARHFEKIIGDNEPIQHALEGSSIYFVVRYKTGEIKTYYSGEYGKEGLWQQEVSKSHWCTTRQSSRLIVKESQLKPDFEEIYNLKDIYKN